MLLLTQSFSLLSVRLFHTSANLLALHNHKLFPKVDWEKVEAGQYAVVDPVNPGVILYLSEQDYIIMVRVAITSNKTLKVLATPSDTPSATSEASNDSSQNSPPSAPTPVEQDASWLRTFVFGRRTSTGRRGQKRAQYIFSSPLLKYAKRVQGQEIIRGLYDGIMMVNLTDRNIREWFHTWHERLAWWSRGSQLSTVSKIEANSFGLRLLRILKRNGINHLIARMKIMLFVVNAYLGGRKLTSTQDLGFRIKLSNGLPTLLPRIVRDGIRIGNRHYIHIWTSVLFSYKGILGTWQEPFLAEGSITNPHPNILDSDLKGFHTFVRSFWQVLKTLFHVKTPDLTVRSPFFSTKAGPNHPITLLGAGIDAFLWFALDSGGKAVDSSTVLSAEEATRLSLIREVTGIKRNYIRLWLEETGQLDLLKKIRLTAKMFAIVFNLSVVKDREQYTISLYKDSPARKGQPADMKPVGVVRKYIGKFESPLRARISNILGQDLSLNRFTDPTLQRLHNLYEAAGKVRTIAIVDYWTNFVLKPLHDWMFTILQNLPQDATFDQTGRVEEFAQRGYTEVYSYDLKSATDLIPFRLYEVLLGEILPSRILELWKALLIDREFLVPKSTISKFANHPRRIRYSTGQPMGALTSWASMALVHHALVLYAAVLAGKTSLDSLLAFTAYLVLGDDIVIADAKVAEMYMDLMRKYSIPVGLAKSHISNIGMFNFANQTFVGKTNVSPISMREDLNANSLPARAELVMRMARRGWLDVTSRTWLITVLRKFFDSRMWYSAIAPLVQHRKLHPVINWIVATLLTPGATRFGFTGMSHVDLDTFLAAQLRKGALWSTRVSDLYKFLDRRRSDGLLISILGRWTDRIYRQFLDNRNRFLGFETWVTSVTSVYLEWLFRMIFEQARKSAFDRWTSHWRMTLKELQVSAKMTAIKDRHLFEIATGLPWSELIAQVATAEAELPLVPDFTQDQLEVISSTDKDGGASTARLYRQQLDSFLRVTSLLGMVDHLGPLGTPGFVEPEENLKSSVPHL